MSDNLHIADTDLALYALGVLSPAEMAAIKTHLDTCPVCSEDVRQSAIALAAYAQTTEESALPSGARDRFLTRLSETSRTVTGTAASPETRAAASAVAGLASGLASSDASLPIARQATAPVAETRKPSFWASIRFSPILAGALAVALLVVGLDDMRKRAEILPLIHQARRGAADSAQLAQLMDLLTSPQAKKVALHQTPAAAPPPDGRVVYSARTGKLLLTASNLHPLPEGKVYELWLLQPGGQKPLPAGTFEPDKSGYATMVLPDAPQGREVAGFGVTIENEGGSNTPTLPIVLSGS
jgi:anti-sigma-K factor RskA